jgi:hypothetical protein
MPRDPDRVYKRMGKLEKDKHNNNKKLFILRMLL